MWCVGEKGGSWDHAGVDGDDKDQESPHGQANQKIYQGQWPADWAAISLDEFYFPGAHAKGLPAMSPEPPQKNKEGGEDVQPDNNVVTADTQAIGERQGRDANNDQDREY